MTPIVLEACVDSIGDAMAAVRAGADRIELCADLLEGGTTPSLGTLVAARRHLAVPIIALVRPRAGDFVHDSLEHEVMLADIDAVKSTGLDGVALGVLTAAGEFDLDRMRALVARARPLQVTCHRAFDLLRDLPAALDQLIALGVDRVLTAGGSASASNGIPILRELVRQASGRIAILAGGGIRASSVARLVRETGVREVHAGPRRARDVTGNAGPFATAWQTDAEAIGALRAALAP